MKNKLSHHDVFTTTATATTIETIIEEEEEDDNYCFSEEGEEEEEEESDSDDETVVTTTLTPWTKEYETQTLHSFDTSKSESKSNIKRKMSHIKHQMTAWRQKHFSKKKQNLLATFRRKT
ncbi:hypothetical protein K501DRAFT_283803 [Backusella circina FSU 941]|nr:hypothetical protein K501DRAFT_283803 [Backusella circina FSU 941]